MPIHFAPISPPTGYTRPPNEVHTEFPKWVHFTDGRASVLVDDAEQEKSLLQGNPPVIKTPEVVTAPSMVLVGENDEMTMLKKIAAEHNIRIDGRWSLSKVRSAVTAVMPLPKE